MVPGTTVSHCHTAGEDDSSILGAMLQAVETFAAGHALPAPVAQRLAIVVEELVTNVVSHGSEGRGTTVTLSLDRDDAGVLLTLDDDGRPFDPRGALDPDLPHPEHGGGVGLALVKAWTDIACYERRAEGNRLVLRLRPAPL